MELLVLLLVVAWLVYAFVISPASRRAASSANKPGHATSPAPTLRPGVVTECHVAGFPHCVNCTGPESIDMFVPGMLLEAVRESSNHYDPMAIMLMLAGRKVGYVPRVSNRVHALHMDAGGELRVRVESVNRYDMWSGVSIRVANL